MPYATKADIESLYGSDVLLVASDANNEHNTNETVVARSLDDATALIDGYVATAYQLPLANPPSILKTFCVDIALYRMALTWSRSTLEMRQRYEDAISYLEKVAKGVVSLNIPAAALPEETGSQFTIGSISPVRR